MVLIVLRKVGGVGSGGGKDVTPTEPAKSEIQGQGLQVHLPEAFRLLWQVPTKDPQIKKYKEVCESCHLRAWLSQGQESLAGLLLLPLTLWSLDALAPL